VSNNRHPRDVLSGIHAFDCWITISDRKNLKVAFFKKNAAGKPAALRPSK